MLLKDYLKVNALATFAYVSQELLDKQAGRQLIKQLLQRYKMHQVG